MKLKYRIQQAFVVAICISIFAAFVYEILLIRAK